MKTLLFSLFMLHLSFFLCAQENKLDESSTSGKWGVNFDKNKLENRYPDSEFKDSPIRGVWLEQSEKCDTLFFYPYYDGKAPMFNLKRGRDKTTNLPKQNSGSYHYRLEDGFIKVQWILSSLILYEPYFIQISNDSCTMKVGDFYASGYQKNDTLIFNRIDAKSDY